MPEHVTLGRSEVERHHQLGSCRLNSGLQPINVAVSLGTYFTAALEPDGVRSVKIGIDISSFYGCVDRRPKGGGPRAKSVANIKLKVLLWGRGFGNHEGGDLTRLSFASINHSSTASDDIAP